MARDTSIEAFKHITENGTLTKRRMEVYKWLYENGPATGKEVHIALSDSSDNSGMFATRLSELKRQGVVQEVGVKVCNHTGRNVILWDVTSLSTPLKLVKKKTKLDVANDEIVRLKRILDVHGICYKINQPAF